MLSGKLAERTARFSSRGFSPSIALLNEVQRGLREVPPFPQALLRINKELQSDQSDVKSLARVLAIDPVIAATVLRIANSPSVGVQRTVVSIADAITFIGFSTVKALVFRVQMGVIFSAPNEEGCYDSNKLWVHATAVARASEELAKRSKVDPNLAFMAGLLHDIGRIAINSQFPQTVRMLWSDQWTAGDSFLDRERRLFGGDHTTMGAFVAEEWNLPGELVQAIRWHHCPLNQVPTKSLELRKILGIVSLANRLVKSRHAYCDAMAPDETNMITPSELHLPAFDELLANREMSKMVDRAVTSVADIT